MNEISRVASAREGFGFRISRRRLPLVVVGLVAAVTNVRCGEEKIRIRDDNPDAYFKGEVTVNLGDHMQFADIGGFLEGEPRINWQDLQTIYEQPVDVANPFTVINPLIQYKTTDSRVLVHMLQLPLTVKDKYRRPPVRDETVYINLNPTEKKYTAPIATGEGFVSVVEKEGQYFVKDANGQPTGAPLEVGRIRQDLPES